MVMQINTPLLITTGEPAGIGMDIVLLLASQGKLVSHNQRSVVVLADANAMQQRLTQLQKATGNAGLHVHINQLAHLNDLTKPEQNSHNHHPFTNCLNVWHLPCQNPVVAGQLDIANAAMVVDQLSLAAKLALNQQAAAIITAPVQKSIINDANIRYQGNAFTGHTEFFMQQAGVANVVMMLANSHLRVALVTTHLPLKDVAQAITPTSLTQVIDILLADLTTKFAIANPRILVCGLNPHAGEGGHLGREEIDTINPVLQSYRNKGVNISLSLPADTLFNPHNLSHCDAVLAMYHDQGLPVLKSHGFGETVNITLGLPFVRTSVDHGTALDLAATGKAKPDSLLCALQLADSLTTP